jgi:hypothetical protein
MNRSGLILSRYRAARDVPFAWNAVDDCLGWAASVAREMLDRDPIASLRGRYGTETGAKRVMAKEGWKSLADVAGAFFREIPAALAQTGDWAVVTNPDGSETIGVVCGSTVAAKTANGMGQVLRGRIVKAFRVE